MKIQKFDLLVALYIFGVMVAELMGAKTFPILHIGHFVVNASVAIFVMPLLFTTVDVIIEVHGKNRARSVVYSGLMMVVLLTLYSALAVHLLASAHFKHSEPAYDAVFGASIRISLASLAAFASSELLDVLIFSKLRQKMHQKALWLRNNVANFVSQFVDSAVFLVLAFYAVGEPFGTNMGFIIGLLIPYWLIRCVLSIFETPLVYLGVRWLRGDKANAKLSETETATA
ncbi:MAG TPA: queuosine precursor transporter [Candidatus Saccharimonadales bacterium]|nr:queuosine precursor transporter [Candidatus Saccharimonadales bacterium]